MKTSSVSLIICTLAVYACAAQESAIHIPDPQLKAAIENKLWLGDPTPSDMLALTSLNLSACKIENLTGLEYAKNLHSLRLTHNQVEDLSPLSKLTNLRTLVPNNNQITDLSPLSGLTQLRHLDIHENQIESVTALAGLTELKYLNLHENQIRRISGLANLKNLQHLDLNNNPIADLSPLSTLNKLHYLNLSNNHISEISALSGLANLTTLYMYNSYVSDISPLSGLTDLELLSLPNNQISDVSALSGLTNLTELYLNYNQISEVSALSGLTMLSRLWLHDNPLNQQACDTYIPHIIANNPGIVELRHDACTAHPILKGEVPPAREIHVDDNATNDPGPNDLSISDSQEDGTEKHPYDSIQEAIDQAQDLDQILVHKGTYYETLNLMGKCLTISAFSPDSSNITAYPVIDAHDQGTVVTFQQEEDHSCILSGLVLTGGLSDTGSAIACIGASPTFRNCLIVGNRCSDPAGAIIYCGQSHSVFENCTIADNCAGANGAALYSANCNLTVANSILWANLPGQVRVESGNDPLILYSDVQGSYPGMGNTDLDPLFACSGYWADPLDPELTQTQANAPDAIWMQGDYHLLSEIGCWDPSDSAWIQNERSSPCIDAGDPDAPWAAERQPHGANINMGAYGGTDQASYSLRAMPVIAHWRFDESTGVTAYDAAGDKHGTVQGAAWTNGILGGALAFDGVDDYVDCGSDPALAPDLFTIALWIHTQALSGTRSILRKAGGDKDKDYDFKLFAGRNPTFSFGDGSQSVVLHSNSVIPPNEWTHITLTRDDTEAAIHINGAQLMRKTYDIALSATDHTLIIGGGSLQPYQGRIDDVQIYGTVLSAEDIERLVHEPDH